MNIFIRILAGFGLAWATTATAQTDIKIDQESPIGTIRPEIYGQFVEFLGTQVYDGIWVSKNSDIPNTDGFRDDVFEALDNLDIPVMRWPGGCYADIYHWRDGIGPQKKRTPRVNIAWGGTKEPNNFGTHEFFNLAEKLGAKTYLNVNLGSGTIEEAMDWLEYITWPEGTALAAERKKNGRAEPWKVDYLSIGNETWGCGGHMKPDYYADLYAHWATFMKTGGEQPKRIISGSHDSNIDYSDKLLDHPDIKSLSEGISLHFYTLPTQDWGDKGEATGFPEAEWFSTLHRTLEMKRLISEQTAMLDAHEMGDEFGLYVDEWGVWVNGEEGDPALYQQNTMREAVVAALNFNIFHTNADRVAMTNIAQMVNVLQAMILTDGPDMLLTPTYHVFEMYRPFQGATAMPVIMDSPSYSFGEDEIPALSASAAMTVDGQLVLALVNADPAKSHTIRLQMDEAVSAEGRILTGPSIDSHNTFEAPDVVAPAPAEGSLIDEVFSAELPPRSLSVWMFGIE